MTRADRRTLLDRHLSLVEAIASTIYRDVRRHVERDDLIAWGTQGLLEAAQRYDATLGASFATFAHYRIRGAIYDGVRQATDLPHHLYRRLLAARRIGEYLENLERRQAAARGVDPSQPAVMDSLRELRKAMRSVAAMFVVSLDERDHSGRPDMPSQAADAGEILAEKRLLSKLRWAIEMLPEKERHFIEQCYYEGKSVTEAGRELGLSRSWSSRIHARAVDRLRDLLGDETP